MTAPFPGRHQLSPEENERIFREDIVPKVLRGAAPQSRPVVVFIGGQTGAGKTGVTQMITDALQRQGGYINANMDFYTPHHPAYSQLLAQDETTASTHVRPDTERWWVKAQHHAISQRYNVVIETALRSPAEFEELVPAFRAGGYTIEVALMAVPQSLSRLGVLSRYLAEVDQYGKGRLIEPAVHDECYRGVLRAAEALEERDLADTVFVFRRDGHAVYTNRRDDTREWIRPPACAAAVVAERTRPWTAQERQWFSSQTNDLLRRSDPAWHPEIHRIRLLAQPSLMPVAPALTTLNRPSASPHQASAAPPSSPSRSPDRGPSR